MSSESFAWWGGGWEIGCVVVVRRAKCVLSDCRSGGGGHHVTPHDRGADANSEPSKTDIQ